MRSAIRGSPTIAGMKAACSEGSRYGKPTSVSQADRLGQPGPHVDHVGHHRIPLELAAAPDNVAEGLAVVVGNFLAGVDGVARGDLRREVSERDKVRHAVAHGRDVTV